MHTIFEIFTDSIKNFKTQRFSGKVAGAKGLSLEVKGLEHVLSVGDRCVVKGKRQEVHAEVVALNSDTTLMLPFGSWEGVSVGSRVDAAPEGALISPDISWKGRVINAFAHPIDGKGRLKDGPKQRYIKDNPPNSYSRRRVGEKLETKVKAMDIFVPICRGQRLGVFAGSGVGKSTLMSMLARNANVDIVVIGLVGERGREVQDFIQEDLGEEGLENAVVVVSTGDEPALMRRQAAWTTMTIAEHFRDLGLHVLVLMDSVTRFAMAQREIGLSGGEPPTTKGYPPTVFAELPRLMERAGPGSGGQGDITAVFTVLVDGDDHNEPISDAARGILDGHIVLDRKIADRGRYPAINVIKSVSRMLPDCHTEEEYDIMRSARALLSNYEDMEELIKIGAYREGTDPETDASIRFFTNAENYLTQRKSESEESFTAFENMRNMILNAIKR